MEEESVDKEDISGAHRALTAVVKDIGREGPPQCVQAHAEGEVGLVRQFRSGR